MKIPAFIRLCCILTLTACGESQSDSTRRGADNGNIRLQLNWFHDPTFGGEYRAAQQLGSGVKILEGGVNVNSLQRLKAGLADVAVSGIDVALKAIESDIAKDKYSPLRIVFVDFQRNPVGWILHPDVSIQLGSTAVDEVSGRERNDWLFDQFRNKRIRVGDKLGTETSAVWASWRHKRGLVGITITQVGFDPVVVLDAPRLAYPVYLNEEPFKLSERIGRPVLVFDPADDGVVLYGNVLVTTDSIMRTKSAELNHFLAAVVDGWRWNQSHPDSAALLIGQYYQGVSDSVLFAQVQRTTEFVFYGGRPLGEIEVQSGGRLDQTIEALKASGALQPHSNLDSYLPYITPYLVDVK
jgi:ABC-type nitrate/sulfonate/bicarbonate transport system substrate-binding protein